MQRVVDLEAHVVAGGIVLRKAHQEFPGGNVPEHMVEAADVIRVRVGVERVGERGDVQVIQQRFDLLPLGAAAVDEHRVFAAAHERRVAAVDLGKEDLQQLGVLRKGEVRVLAARHIDDDRFFRAGRAGGEQHQAKRQNSLHRVSLLWRQQSCAPGFAKRAGAEW